MKVVQLAADNLHGSAAEVVVGAGRVDAGRGSGAELMSVCCVHRGRAGGYDMASCCDRQYLTQRVVLPTLFPGVPIELIHSRSW